MVSDAVETQNFASLQPASSLPSHHLLPVFLPVLVRHVQHVHAGGDVVYVHRGEQRTGRRILRTDRPSLQVVQGDVGDARAGEFNVEEVIGGVGIDGEGGLTILLRRFCVSGFRVTLVVLVVQVV